MTRLSVSTRRSSRVQMISLRALAAALVGLAFAAGPAGRAEAPTQTMLGDAAVFYYKTPERQPRPSRSLTMKARVVRFAAATYDARNAKAFVEIIFRESRFDYLAENPSSGAYGLGQALPGSKMSSVGDDWKTNPYTQLAWVAKYIASRYDTPVVALRHHDLNGWY